MFKMIEFNFNFLNPFVIRNMWKEYAERKKWFIKNYKNNWYTDGGDDAHAFDTIPYNIAENWDFLKENVRKTNKDNKIYLENDEYLSSLLNEQYNQEEYMDKFWFLIEEDDIENLEISKETFIFLLYLHFKKVLPLQFISQEVREKHNLNYNKRLLLNLFPMMIRQFSKKERKIYDSYEHHFEWFFYRG